jgi:hypothetical protein
MENTTFAEPMTNNRLKTNLLIYLIITAFTYTYLVLPDKAGISAPLFTISQFICLWLTAPKKKPLIIFAPMLILSLNSFISANYMWRGSNWLVSLLLYCVMSVLTLEKFDIKNTSPKFIGRVFEAAFAPFRCAALPFKWAGELGKDDKKLAKRIFTALIIAAPLALFILILLSSADIIFSNYIHGVLKGISKLINFSAALKIIYGVIAGIYLFGLAYYSHAGKIKPDAPPSAKTRAADLLVVNIILSMII